MPSAIASMLMGNTPELMLAYTSYIESIVPGMRVNAKNIFGARGIVLPSRTTTNGYNNALAPRFAGGMPAVIIKMLASSDLGTVQLLPALPKAWPSGTIEGVLCRGQIEIKSLKWTPGKITVTLLSAKEQKIDLKTPADIRKYEVTEGKASVRKTSRKNVLNVTLPKQQAVTIEIVK